MKPLDFYELGLKLASSAQTEAEQRNAIGRLYYGLHHEACCRYFREESNVLPLERLSRHHQLIQRFRSLEKADAAEEISNLLQQLLRMRNSADYELRQSIRYNNIQLDSRQLLRLALIVAQDLIQALEAYSPGAAPEGCDCLIERC